MGDCRPLSTKPTRHPLPPNTLGKSSYSPLLDLLLRDCKRKQKSSLLVQRGVPGDGHTLVSLPPARPSPRRPVACLPPSGHRPALSEDMPPGAQPPAGRLLPAVLGWVGRTVQRLGYGLFHFSVLGTIGEGAGFPRRSAARPGCGGLADGPGPLLGPTAPSTQHRPLLGPAL